MDEIKRKLLKTGAVSAVALAATPSVLAQQPASAEGGRYFQRGDVRIRYEEVGSGFP